MIIFITTMAVSTHSRPKAAEINEYQKGQMKCFNTQPPEGG